MSGYNIIVPGGTDQAKTTEIYIKEASYSKIEAVFAYEDMSLERREQMEEILRQTEILHMQREYHAKRAAKQIETPKPDSVAILLPPQFAENISAYFVPRELRDSYLGSRSERYQLDVQRLGESEARRLYQWDTFVDLLRVVRKFVSLTTITNLGSALLRWWA